MGTTVRERCRKIIENLKADGSFLEVTDKQLITEIKNTAGFTPATIKLYMSALVEYGFVKRKTHGVYTIIGDNDGKDSVS